MQERKGFFPVVNTEYLEVLSGRYPLFIYKPLHHYLPVYLAVTAVMTRCSGVNLVVSWCHVASWGDRWDVWNIAPVGISPQSSPDAVSSVLHGIPLVKLMITITHFWVAHSQSPHETWENCRKRRNETLHLTYFLGI